MSNSYIYHYDNGRFKDLTEDELCSMLSEFSGLYATLKAEMPPAKKKGTLEIKDLGESSQYRFNDDEFKPIHSLFAKNLGPVETNPVKPQGSYYRFQLKAEPNSVANQNKAFKYKLSLNHGDDQEFHFPESVDLHQMVEMLLTSFAINKTELLSRLAQLDIGTFQVSLDKVNESFKIKDIYQAQAISFKKHEQANLEKKVLDYEKEIAELKKQNHDQKLKIEEFSKTLRQLDELREIQDKYDELLMKLGLDQKKEKGIEDLKKVAQKTKLIPTITDLIQNKITRDLRQIGLKESTIETGIKQYETMINDFIYNVADDESINKLDNIKGISELSKIHQELYDKILAEGSDRILYHFSSPESRQIDLQEKLQRIMREYNLEFFTLESGSPVSVHECRFAGVKDSNYPRGYCVETVALGIRQSKNKQIYYKADVIIST